MIMPESIENALNALVPVFSKNKGTITSLDRLSGGASQQIWAFEVDFKGAHPKRYILRRSPENTSHDSISHKISLTTEALLLRAAAEANLPVPPVVHICTPTDGLGDAFIMDFVNGETIARKIQRDETYAAARERFAHDCGNALAKIHQIPSAALPDLPTLGAAEQIVQFKAIFRQLNIIRPTFELAFQHLKKTTPESLQPVLIHGDFRLGNLIIGHDGLRAILDWELAHLGDPREDIGWLCVNSWRFGAANPVGGIGQLSEFLSAYEASGGQAFTATDIRWWQMLGTLKWGIMCMIMYDSFRNGTAPTAERAAIGRRVSETEIDLINLMQERG